MAEKVKISEDVLNTTDHNHGGDITTYHLVQVNDNTAVFTDDSYNPVELSIYPEQARKEAIEKGLDIVDPDNCPEFEVSD